MRLRSATYKLGLIPSLLAAATAAGIVCAQVPGGCNTPVSQRTGEAGCYLTATELLGALPQAALFWHLYVYPTHAAAESAKGSRGTVDRKSTRLNSSHLVISYAVFCLKKKNE